MFVKLKIKSRINEWPKLCMVRVHYFAVMVTGIQFFNSFYESQVEYLRKAFTKEKKGK